MKKSFNKIICDMDSLSFKGKQPEVCYHYISPVLLRRGLGEKPITHRMKEMELADERFAKPIRVFAQTGKLELEFQETSVNGSVWIKGYDPVESAFAEYRAQIKGRLSKDLKPAQNLLPSEAGFAPSRK